MFKFGKLVGIISATTIVALSLTACSQEKPSYNFDETTVSQMPSWSASTVDTLKKEGWSFNIATMFPEGTKDNPTIIYGNNKDETCSMTFGSEISKPTNEKLGDKFNSQEQLLSYMRSSMSTDMVKIDITETQISVEGSNSKLDLVEGKYDTPYYGPGSQASMNSGPTDSAPVLPKPEGTIHNWTAIRALTKNYIANPVAELARGSKNEAKVEKEGTTVVTLNYQCLNNGLDDKIINLMKTNAKINIK